MNCSTDVQIVIILGGMIVYGIAIGVLMTLAIMTYRHVRGLRRGAHEEK